MDLCPVKQSDFRGHWENRMGKPNQITGLNADGPNQFLIPTPAAHVGQFLL